MNILITGGCGHIGSHLIRSLPHQDNLTVVDNFLTQRYCSLFNLERQVKFLEKDIKDVKLENIKDIDIVIHLAAITNAADSFGNKREVEKINYHETKAFIDVCEKANCKFVFPSSTSVYGVSADLVYEDDDKFINPQSPYAESKIKIENYLKENISNYLILRFGTIFGISEGMRFHTAINKFCYEASLGRPLTIWKQNYEQHRPYLGLNDAIRAISFFLEKDHWNNTYNVLTGNYKLRDIVSNISKILDVELNMIDTPLLNQYSYKVSDEKIRKIGFYPCDNLKESIVKSLKLLNGLS